MILAHIAIFRFGEGCATSFTGSNSEPAKGTRTACLSKPGIYKKVEARVGESPEVPTLPEAKWDPEPCVSKDRHPAGRLPDPHKELISQAILG